MLDTPVPIGTLKLGNLDQAGTCIGNGWETLSTTSTVSYFDAVRKMDTVKSQPPTTVASRLLSGGVHFRSKKPAQFDGGTCFSLFNSSTLVTLIQRLSVDAMTLGSPDVTRQRDPGSVSWLTNEI